MANSQSTLPNDEKEAQDSAYNPGEQAYREGMGAGNVGAGIDQAEAFINDPAHHDSADAIREAEANPDDASLDGGLYKPSEGGKKSSKVSAKNIFVKRGGIIGLITTIVLGGGIAGITLLSPAGLFIQLANTFTNAFDDSSSALSIRTNKLLSLKANGLKNAFDQSSDGKCDIKCKFGTISETMKNNLDSPTNKFKATYSDRKFGGRYTIDTITFPSGEIAHNGAEFAALMKKPINARDFNKVFNSKIKFFLNGSPFALALKNKLAGLDRRPKISGDSKEAIDESLRKAVGASGATAAEGDAPTLESKKTSVSEKLHTKVDARVSAASTGVKVTDVVAAGCLAYDVTRISVAVTKAAKIAAFASFAISFLSVKGEIMAGDADPNVVSTLGAQLTDAGSATDAPIYGQAARGDTADNTTGFSIQPSGGFSTALAGIGGAIGVNAVARGTAHAACSSVNNPAAPVLQCAPEILAGLLEAGVGAVVNAVGCIGINVIGGLVAGAAIGAAIPGILDAIAKGDLKIPDETTRGKAAGQVIGLGAEAALNGKSQTYGLSAATSAAQVVAYNNATLDSVHEQTAIARLDAADQPLNVNNQYTFVGSLASKLNLSAYKGASVLGAITKTLGIVPLSFASASSSIYAESGYPLGYDKSTVFKSGNDASLDGIGVLSDKNGFPTYVMNDASLAEDSYTAIDNLQASGDIDNNGNAIPGSDYDKYQTYCGINRSDPMGETSGSISDDDYEWEIGAKCVDPSAHFNDIRVYTMDSMINDTTDGTYANNSAAAATTGKAVLPLQPGYTITAGFGPRQSPCPGCSSIHPAVDLAEPLGKPVYAIMDGEVIAVDTSGNYPVSIKHANGTVSQYLHMYPKDITVHVGDKVTAGEQIGKVGQSGEATGPHLDLRIYIDGVDLTKEPAIANIATDHKNIVEASGHSYINPILYMALFGVTI